MYAFIAVVLLLGAVAYADDSSEWGQGGGKVKTNCTCGATNKQSGRIVGGRDAQVNEYPLIAGIVYTGRPHWVFCGGTVITQYHVLTAAHCKPATPRPMSVILAEHDTSSSTESKTVIIDVLEMINHQKYNNLRQHNDIAVLVLMQKIPFGKNIGPACFPKAGLDIVGSKVRVIGWGNLYSKGPKPSILQKVDLDVKPNSECSKVYSAMGITSGHLCTYTVDKDACQGDSGGPVIWLDPSTNRYTVVGIVSYGRGCAQVGTPGVNTAVVSYRDWILTTIAQTLPQATTCQSS